MVLSNNILHTFPERRQHNKQNKMALKGQKVSSVMRWPRLPLQ